MPTSWSREISHSCSTVAGEPPTSLSNPGGPGQPDRRSRALVPQALQGLLDYFCPADCPQLPGSELLGLNAEIGRAHV